MERDLPSTGPVRFLGKGDFKFLVLRALRDRPMHGYEVMKVLQDHFHGFYKPSPGAIYPTLASLERKGLLKSQTSEGRKAYSLTRQGKTYLRSCEAHMQKRFRELEKLVGPERASLMRELRSLGRLLIPRVWNLSPEKAEEVRTMLERFRRDLEDKLSD